MGNLLFIKKKGCEVVSIYEDKERGTWYFITRIEQLDGSSKQEKRRGFKSEKAALLAEAKFEDEAEAILNDLKDAINEDNVTFEYAAKEYLKWYKKRRKASSYTKISSIVTIHLIPEFGKSKLKSIRPRDVTRYQDDIIEDYKPSHIKKIHSVLSAAFNFAIRQEYTKENPAQIAGNVDLEEDRKMDYWTLEEFKEFIGHVDDPLYRALFMTLYYSGLRKGELLALTWGDVDFDNDIINVDKTEYNRVVTTPKTPASRRKLYMPKHVMRLLSRLKADNKPKMTYVVFGEFMDSVSTSTLDRQYEKYIKLSSVKRIRLHDFRHSHASYLINNGAIISVVAARLGHGDVATTLNTYSHLYPTTEKEAVLQMEDDFKSAEIVEFKTREK